MLRDNVQIFCVEKLRTHGCFVIHERGGWIPDANLVTKNLHATSIVYTIVFDVLLLRHALNKQKTPTGRPNLVTRDRLFSAAKGGGYKGTKICTILYFMCLLLLLTTSTIVGLMRGMHGLLYKIHTYTYY